MGAPCPNRHGSYKASKDELDSGRKLSTVVQNVTCLVMETQGRLEERSRVSKNHTAIRFLPVMEEAES